MSGAPRLAAWAHCATALQASDLNSGLGGNPPVGVVAVLPLSQGAFPEAAST